MVKWVLVTTALEAAWPEDEPVLFLGEWCRLYSRRQRWSEMDHEVLPYHWDDREKLESDFHYLTELSKRLLVDLAGQLNQLHGVDHSLRYWRILIGPWFDCFIHSVFDRWSTVQQAVQDFELVGAIVLENRHSYRAPKTMFEFETRILNDEENQCLYADILEKYTQVPCIKRQFSNDVLTEQSAPIHAWKHKLKGLLADGILRIASVFTRDDDFFLVSTYLPLLDEKKVYLRLGQVPQHWRSTKLEMKEFDGERRKWKVPGNSLSEYEDCIRTLIPKYMPVAYLEGYAELIEMAGKQRWPKQPKLIWTSNAHIHDEVLKVWLAEKVESGARFAIGQHGGHSGAGRIAASEEHDTLIADGFMSWGWSDPERPQIKPVGLLKVKQPLGVCHAEQAHILLVTKSVPRYSYRVNSAMIGRQWLDHFHDHCDFVDHLPQHIRSALVVRLYSADYEWSQKARWNERFADLNIDEGKVGLVDMIRQSRILISTYNGTTFLESFSMNVPTVMYWNPNHWELRKNAVPYFELLKSVGIFHENPVSAARHVSEIWDDVDAWWSSAPVREAIAQFTNQFSRIPKDLLDDVARTLREISQTKIPENVN